MSNTKSYSGSTNQPRSRNGSYNPIGNFNLMPGSGRQLASQPPIPSQNRLPNPSQNRPPQNQSIETLTPEQINYVQAYLEQIKIDKLNHKMRRNCHSPGMSQMHPVHSVHQIPPQKPVNPWNDATVGYPPGKMNEYDEYEGKLTDYQRKMTNHQRNPMNAWSSTENYGYSPQNDVQMALPMPQSSPLERQLSEIHPGFTFGGSSQPDLNLMDEPIEFRNGFGAGSGIEHDLSAGLRSRPYVPHNRMTDIYDPEDRGVPDPGDRGLNVTRNGRKTTNDGPIMEPIFNGPNSYYNPYEYGSKQNEFGSIYKPTYTGPYQNDSGMLNEMGISEQMYQETFPGLIRNVNIESTLLQKELTHGPGQRDITERGFNRFELLPFDPQDHKHIVWRDDMPRGGYPTRVDRLETL